MPTYDELHAADQQHTAAIAELRRQMRERAEEIKHHEERLERLDDCLQEMRDTLATREDIRDLRADLRDRFDHYRTRIDTIEDGQQDRMSARDTRQSKIMNWTMVTLFVAEVAMGIIQYQWMRRHG